MKVNSCCILSNYFCCWKTKLTVIQHNSIINFRYMYSIKHNLSIVHFMIVSDSNPLDEVEDENDLTSKKRKTTSTSGSSHRATTRTPLVTLQGHTQPATGVVWVEQGEIVSAGWDMCIRVWDVTTGSNTAMLVSIQAFSCTINKSINIIREPFHPTTFTYSACG